MARHAWGIKHDIHAPAAARNIGYQSRWNGQRISAPRILIKRAQNHFGVQLASQAIQGLDSEASNRGFRERPVAE